MATRPAGRSRPAVAALLSFILPGLGQVWLGAVWRGLLVAFPAVLTVVVVVTFLVGGMGQFLTTIVRPDVLLVILVANVVLALYHALAVTDAWVVARRQAAPAPAAGGAGRGRSRATLVLLLAATIGLHGSIELLGVDSYSAAASLFRNEGEAWAIPSPSFGPTPSPSPAPSAEPQASPTPTPVPVPGWATDGRLNVLLLGSDAGPGRWLVRTDTMVLLSIDVATARTALFGIPRNLINVPLPPESAGAFANGRYPGMLNSLYVYAMGHESQFPGGDARGFRAVTGAIQELVGAPLDGVVSVDLNGFVKLVDAIGGVWIDIPSRVYDDHYPKPDGSGYITISFRAGCQKLNGIRALEYARTRHQDSDYNRMTRQQSMLIAIARQVDPLALLPKVPDLLDVVRDDLWTTLRPEDLGDLAALASRVDMDGIQRVRFVPPTIPEFLTTKSIARAKAMVAEVFDGGPGAATPSPEPRGTPRPACPTP